MNTWWFNILLVWEGTLSLQEQIKYMKWKSNLDLGEDELPHHVVSYLQYNKTPAASEPLDIDFSTASDIKATRNIVSILLLTLKQ